MIVLTNYSDFRIVYVRRVEFGLKVFVKAKATQKAQ